MAGIVPTQQLEQEDFNIPPMALQARFISANLPRIMVALRESNAALVIINQLRDSLGSYTGGEVMPGGKAQRYFAHLILFARRVGWITPSTKDKTRIGFNIKIAMDKTKAGGDHYSAVEVPFRVEGGIDPIETNIREGEARGLVIKKGAYYYYGGEKGVMGLNGLREFFMNNPELYKTLEDDLDAGVVDLE